MRIDQPQFNHNAGAVNFGPDGMLYFTLGDGGGADDRDHQGFLGSVIFGHGCRGNGSDPTNILGTVVRIDPLGNNANNAQYGIPKDNPFVGGPELDEIYAYGFRNPFRFSFDTANGDLYLADVGQHDIEEVNLDFDVLERFLPRFSHRERGVCKVVTVGAVETERGRRFVDPLGDRHILHIALAGAAAASFVEAAAVTQAPGPGEYIKIGSFQTAGTLSDYLNRWIGNYVLFVLSLTCDFPCDV